MLLALVPCKIYACSCIQSLIVDINSYHIINVSLYIDAYVWFQKEYNLKPQLQRSSRGFKSGWIEMQQNCIDKIRSSEQPQGRCSCTWARGVRVERENVFSCREGRVETSQVQTGEQMERQMAFR